MTIKHLLKSAIVLSVVASSFNIANAQDGHYVGFDIGYNDIEHDYKDNDPEDPTFDSDDKAVSFGINYGYKYSFQNGLFINPEIFYDHVDSSAKDSSGECDEQFRCLYYYWL